MVGKSSSPEKVEEFLKNTPHLLPEDISEAVLYCLGTPEHVQVIYSIYYIYINKIIIYTIYINKIIISLIQMKLVQFA